MENPRPIKKLDAIVVNRIAAGEIVHRPANALKELLENSLDAKASLIQITVKAGGLKLLQIQDNGTGIRREDLQILCERFTTSKLEKFEDLNNINTFGFRGEALSSISHVSYLTIQTKTANEKCAYRVQYCDGKMKNPPKPCAGNQGTIITVEELFYNVVQRRQALKSQNEEYQKILDVVCKYAIHNSSVGFSLKKAGENYSIKTTPNSTVTENISLVYGSQISKTLISIELKDEDFKFELTGSITNPNYSNKKPLTVLFINNRLVECQSIKNIIDSVYSIYLAKKTYPFVYLSLKLEPTTVDVNVHPTKHEVHFLHEDEIVEKIKFHLEAKLLGSNDTRIFYKQMKVVDISEGKLSQEKTAADSSSTNSLERSTTKIRTDRKEQKLEKFFPALNEKSEVITIVDTSKVDSSASASTKRWKETKLTSIQKMRRSIESSCSGKLKSIIEDFVFVGIVNEKLSIVQSAAKLYLCNSVDLSKELFRQILIYKFQNFRELIVNPPLSLKDLIRIGIENFDRSDLSRDKTKLTNEAVDILMENSPIMEDYFGLRISKDGCLQSLPILLENHKPPLAYLPEYLLNLAFKVNWEIEEECFELFIKETATYYSKVPLSSNENRKYKWFLEHIIYPEMRRSLIPPSELKNSIYEVAYLLNLIKVFERC